MSAPKRFLVQRLSTSSVSTWRTVIGTESKNEAQQGFLAHTTHLRRGGSVRILDSWEDRVLAKFTQPVHSAHE